MKPQQSTMSHVICSMRRGVVSVFIISTNTTSSFRYESVNSPKAAAGPDRKRDGEQDDDAEGDQADGFRRDAEHGLAAREPVQHHRGDADDGAHLGQVERIRGTGSVSCGLVISTVVNASSPA